MTAVDMVEEGSVRQVERIQALHHEVVGLRGHWVTGYHILEGEITFSTT